jgi:chromosome segregation ATPase
MVSEISTGPVADGISVHFEVEAADPGQENWRLVSITGADLEAAQRDAAGRAEQGIKARVRRVTAARWVEPLETHEASPQRAVFLRARISEIENAQDQVQEQIDELESASEEMEREAAELRAELAKLEGPAPAPTEGNKT